MTKIATPDIGIGASLKPRLLKSGQNPKKSKVYSFVIPKFGRFAYTRDPGEAKLFMSSMISTHLGAIIRQPDGKVVDEFDLGSGVVTNIGVSALANDSNWQTKVAEPINTLNVCKYANWGTGVTAAAATDWKLQTQAENEAGKKEAVAASSSVLKFSATGNAKIVITNTLEANLAGPTAITEWGLFSSKKTEGLAAAKAATATSATSLTDSGNLGGAPVESKAEARGATNEVIWAEKTESVYGLITKNKTTEVTTPGWIKNAAAEAGTTPEATTKYIIYPVMWDHRVFAAINVEKGNKIEFPYELEVKAGG